MAWEENSRICLHMQLIAILFRIGVYSFRAVRDALAEIIRQGIRLQFLPRMLFSITFMI